MATIALYANQINQMPSLLKEVKQSVSNYKSELTTLKNKTLTINKSICDLEDVISSIQSSTQTQEDKIASLDAFYQNSETFIADVVSIDNNVASLINQRKNDFYSTYSYLKPECEKSRKEKWDDFWGGVGEWCRDNWKSLAKIVLAVVIIVALGVLSVLTGGALAVILAGAFWGALSGALIGGAIGGILSAINGSSIFDGIAEGMLSGAISGAITGAAFSGAGIALGALTKGAKGVQIIGKAHSTKSYKSKTLKKLSALHILSTNIQASKMAMQFWKYSKIGLNKELKTMGLKGGKLKPDVIGITRYGPNKIVEVISLMQDKISIIDKMTEMIRINPGSKGKIVHWVRWIGKLFCWK